ncbi:U4/U6.U5 tri-snRNP-associated protein 2-like isoform X2 [Prunus yedoensis var. nudiflora]|uniref:U4/U6.U5 tri-snRNP-associated protein 2-like isoform X2 n=1 Tax=Prunus yedoensis var. nudiflora TaxID=2094558 RepID=A0A314UN71_PRUYE|nr:U4/U6.U5 tri-snRNP-associated protein 2-like isoform X2 [Prunus yedoensis var. nudiflora]
MNSKREHEDNVRVNAEEFESDPKRQKQNRHSSPSSSPPPPASEDDEDNQRRPPVDGYRGDDGGALKLRSGGIAHILMLLIASITKEKGTSPMHILIALKLDTMYDIRHVLNPRFMEEQVEQIDKNRQCSRALDGSYYLPGMLELNNNKETDFVNVNIQSLTRVTPLRNFFLIPKNYQHCKSPLVHRFKGQGELEVVKEIPKKENGDDQNTDAATENNGILKETYKCLS